MPKISNLSADKAEKAQLAALNMVDQGFKLSENQKSLIDNIPNQRKQQLVEKVRKVSITSLYL